MIKFRVPDEYVIIKKEAQGVEYFMMRKKDLPKKNNVEDEDNDNDEFGYKK